MKIILIYAVALLSTVDVRSQSLDQQMSNALGITKEKAETVTEKLISQGVNPNGVTEYGAPYLNVAVRRRMEGTVTLLLNHGANVNVVDARGETHLFSAALFPDGRMEELLIQHGANVNVKNKDGNTPLHRAALGDRDEAIDLLIKAGADVNAKDSTLATPLMLAARNGKLAAIKKLIALEADVKMTDRLGLSALGHAAFGQQPEAIILLAKAGAPIDTSSMQGNMPLLFSCILNKMSKGVAGLVAAGADLKTLYDGYTPLGYAVGVSRDIPTVTAILGGKPDLNAFSHESFVITGFSPEPKLPYNERTALMLAAESGQTEVIKLLLATGAAKTIRSNDNKTSLDLALERGHQEAADLLK